MTKTSDGYFTADVPGVSPGDLYHFHVDGRGPLPDPASRYQPQGVHGPSAIVDPAKYQWHDSGWIGIAFQDIVFYELHLGTFTPEGTFRAAAEKLDYLKDLGITAVELMPLADFAGNHNWGYDGVAPFAPARCYGRPEDLRYLVDQAHRVGLAVFVDAVYNHFGPDGAYQASFSKHYYTQRHQTPWGDGINFDGRMSAPVREYFIENALRWIHEYHFDGLRLDATHAIADDSPQHILAAITSTVAQSSTQLGRQLHVVAEDARNMAKLVMPESQDGLGLTAVWADDLHHEMRRGLTGDSDGYFAEFDGSVPSIAATAKRGWLHGSDTSGVEYSRFVCCIQNHDQIGNRALGDRLGHRLDLAAYRAASALLLLLPETPLLFMGQEWAAGTPFRYFTDHNPYLGTLVTEGRRREFAAFSAFSNEEVPDPQAPETFLASRLDWNELNVEPHASIARLYKSLLQLRRNQTSLRGALASPQLRIEALDDDTILLCDPLPVAIRLRGAGEVDLPVPLREPIWSSEDRAFAPDSRPIHLASNGRRLSFARPGAIVFQSVQEARA